MTTAAARAPRTERPRRAPRLRRRSWRRAPRWVQVLPLVLAALTLVLAETWLVARRRSAQLTGRGAGLVPAAADPAFVRALSLLTATPFEPGNRVEAMLNGDGTYPALWRDLRGARRSIAMQMYYARPGRVSDTTAAVLCERARAGVPVLLLLDAFGAQPARREWLRGLEACGVRVALLRPLEWYTIHSGNQRSHVRAVIVDGRIGWTGGFGLADYWLGDGKHDDQWRESNVRFEGPVVAQLEAAFADAWAEATGELLVAGPFLATGDAAAPTAGGVRAGLLYTTPGVGNSAAERFLALAIGGARHRLWISNSYFVPSETMMRLLEAAAVRGVDVRVLTAGIKTDLHTPWLAGRARYGRLVTHGVRVYEYQPAMMHAKTMVLDGTLSVIGSMNFDDRSLSYNAESDLVVLDAAFAAGMEDTFRDDLTRAREMTRAVLDGRPWPARVLEWGASLVSRAL